VVNTLKLHRNGAVGFIDWLGLWGGILYKCPSKVLTKILEARLADPVIIVLRGVTLMQYVWGVADHELRRAEGAVVVVPLAIRGILTIWPVDELRSREIILLAPESPVSFVCHRG
jgi:hypothetical protein